MHMHLGERIRLSLFGTSHGPRVGALLTGVPKGIVLDTQAIQRAMDTRRPGGRYASKRKEPDIVEFRSGIEDGKTTGDEIEISIANKDAKSRDYSFLPDHPRPGHQDMVMHKRTNGEADLRGGGSSSARLTAALVASAALLSPLLEPLGIQCEAHVGAIGTVEALSMDDCPPRWENEDCQEMRCRDPAAASKMVETVEQHRMNRNSIGSRVDLQITGVPLGLGEPWFDGLEPALARAMMSIPAARGVVFGRGFDVVQMSGLEHNDAWGGSSEHPKLLGVKPDGVLAGLATGSPIHVSIAFKPPSSIASEQHTLNLASGNVEPLVVGGRHDPVLGPRAVAVVEAMAQIVLTDLALRGGFLDA
ncbi:MAG: chorismate synthase [Candidatus Poseidoniales archaeon]|nr:MAG: chorismate synthase [Candidatus Poseidoniales archaeon]